MLIRLSRPDIRKQDIKRMARVVSSGDLVQGRYAARLEAGLAGFIGIKNTAVVSSGTAALHLSLMALNIKPGDHVIVPAFTFPATANVVEVMGAKAVLCDVDRFSYVVTPEIIEAAIKRNFTKCLKAIIVVHEFGCAADMRNIVRVARKYKLCVIEDAACALGAQSGGKYTGYYGDMACFSFHPRKAITSGEGGAVVSNNRILIEKVKKLRNHGISKNKGQIDFVYAGLNYRMTDFQAALLLGQLPRLPREIRLRTRLAQEYCRKLRKIDGIQLPVLSQGHSWQSFMVVLERGIGRGDVIKKLLAKNIQANLGAQALNRLTYYRNKYKYKQNSFPVAEELCAQGLALPLYGRLTREKVGFIAETLAGILRGRKK